MVFVLLLIGAYYSYKTWNEQFPVGAEAASQVIATTSAQLGGQQGNGGIFLVVHSGDDAEAFRLSAEREIEKSGLAVLARSSGGPQEFRAALDSLGDRIPTGIIATTEASNWRLMKTLPNRGSEWASMPVFSPQSYHWPDFLKRSNLLNIADRTVVIAIIAIGMTMVIITGGIDLSVGSLIALSAVVTAWCIREIQTIPFEFFLSSGTGSLQTSPTGMVLACVAGILTCGLIGLFSGTMVTFFRIPPFIVTLAMMLVASGLAYIIAKGESIYEIPEGFKWLGTGRSLGLPNAVILMALLYFVAHVVMSHTPLGRYIYAIGGNREAARLSGVPVSRILLFVYVTSGLLAGIGGVIMASQLKSGAPTYGPMYELYVIAAVVVGGTSLAGGEGRILGTLIGTFVIVVIWNGMNLTNVEAYNQKVVLGLVILAAVLFDLQKRRGLSPLVALKRMLGKRKSEA
ncbi:MAG: ABC transporter permease [Verrucomicrobiota bacterium]